MMQVGHTGGGRRTFMAEGAATQESPHDFKVR